MTGTPPRRLWFQRPGFWTGIALFAAVAFVPSDLHDIPGCGHRPAYAAAVAVLMAAWWFAEALPIGVVACAPLVLFPALGVFGAGPAADLGSAAAPFVDAYIFMFLGGMMIGAAMEESGLHRRVALHIMRVIGARPARLLLGMIVATATVSLWISNTATAVMMLPIAKALLFQLEASRGGRRLDHFGAALMLSVAWASNIGGIGTKIGTGTNSIFCGWVARNMEVDLSFLRFLLVGAPFVVLMVPLSWALLWRLGRRDAADLPAAGEALDRELAAMGAMRPSERKVAAVFAAAALLWIAGGSLQPALRPHLEELGRRAGDGFRFEGKHYEALVAMSAGLTLALARLLSLRGFLGIPFATLLLLGGSFSMAAGIEGSGLGRWLALKLEGVAALPFPLQTALAASATIALSAVASNTATVTVMLNVLPRSLPLLATTAMAASCDFALPAGTPPNAIVFGSGYIRLPVMMRTGLLGDAGAAALLTAYGTLWLPLVLGS